MKINLFYRLFVFITAIVQLAVFETIDAGAEEIFLTQHEKTNRLFYQAHELHKALNKQGYIVNDPVLSDYLRQILERLYPEQSEMFQVFILDTSFSNAFITVNGNVYITTALLASAENEAQIASILAHEGAHFIRKHLYLGYDNLISSIENSSASNLDLDTLLSKHSRESEGEADEIGFERFQGLQYDGNQAIRMFEIIQHNRKPGQIDKDNQHRFHPLSSERIRYFQSKLSNTSGKVETDKYLALGKKFRIPTYQKFIRNFQYYKLIQQYEFNPEIVKVVPEYWYFLGEAYRQRNEIGDTVLQQDAYQNAIDNAPDYAPTYAAMSFLANAEAEPEKAKTYYQQYLEKLSNSTKHPYHDYLVQVFAKQTAPSVLSNRAN